MAAKYQVKQGECIGSIAYEHGFFWETLWNDSNNADLRQQRMNPNILLEGDAVFIPDLVLREESCATEQRHRFRLKGVPAKLRLRILEPDLVESESSSEPEPVYGPSVWNQQFEGDDPDEILPEPSFRPRSDVPYQLWVDGIMTQGRTKGDGQIESSIAPNAQKAKLVLDPGTPMESIISLNLGYLDPLTEVSGVQGRLNNLGFDCGPVDGIFGPRTQRALKRFQASVGLQATGDLDETTRQKLRETHDST